jgi:hypothetical protein
MTIFRNDQSRRSFLGRLASFSAVALGSELLITETAGAAEKGEWDTSWIERVKKAKHRAVFDAPSPGAVLDLATRFINNIHAVYGESERNICPVLNIRTRSVFMGLNDAMWQKYPLGEDAKVTDPDTSTPARRNLDMRVSAEKAAQGYGSIEGLMQQGAIMLVCDFALGHLSNRLAEKMSVKGEDVHLELKKNLVPGAILVPSGIYGVAEAQNAGCAFVPS